MAEITEGRVVAASILRAVSRGRRLDLAFDEAAPSLPLRDRRWVQVATYGTVRLRGRLDHLLHMHLNKGLQSISPFFLDLLRLGAYQLLYMDGVPAYAAISQTVDQVRELAGAGGSKLANGVLRSLEREGCGPQRFPTFQGDPESYLSTWGSHPLWMVQRWLRYWDPEEVLQLVEWNNSPAPLHFRPLGTTPDEARVVLEQHGFVTHGMGAGVPCLRLADGTNPAEILDTLPGIVQDPGAALVTVYGDACGTGPVGDLCAAPGGKTLAMASEGVSVLAADRSLTRLRLLRENLGRVGGRVELVASLAQAPPFRELPSVVLDVPCSGTGTLRRHPDSRWRLTVETVERLVGVQRDILTAASRLVSEGGVLVYSTCSLEPEENESQIEEFLSGNPEFSLENSGRAPRKYTNERGFLSVTPQSSGFDGAFAARMVRGS